jgi:hypothetical protein
MMILDLILSFLPGLGAVAVVVLAQTQVRERSEQAALALTIGGGVEIAYLLVRHFASFGLLWDLAPLVRVGSVGAICFGLILLINELNPKLPGAMPAALAALPAVQPNMFQRVFWGGFGALAIFATSLRISPVLALMAVVGIAATMFGSVWVERQGPLGRWILERRPELVMWSYVHQLRVVNRKTGSTSVHWSAQLGLASGALVPIPANGEAHAQTLVAGVRERCPGVALGFSNENLTRFNASPQTMRGGAPTLR